MGQTVAVAVSSDSTLRLCVDDVDYGIVAHDVCLTHCHAVVDLYGRCNRLCVVDDCGAPASPAVSEYQEKAAKENGNCTTMSRYTRYSPDVDIFQLKDMYLNFALHILCTVYKSRFMCLSVSLFLCPIWCVTSLYSPDGHEGVLPDATV